MSSDPSIDLANLEALRRGETGALNRLIARWQRPLHSFAFRYCQNESDAEDLVAQTFVRLYQQRDRLRVDTNVSAWLFTTLTNLCHNHHRWKKRHPTVSLNSATGTDGPSPPVREEIERNAQQDSPDRRLEHDETLAAVRAAIDCLPHDLKVTLLLHHYDRLSYREIGAITGCSERGVETRLYRARNLLRSALSTHLTQPAH